MQDTPAEYEAKIANPTSKIDDPSRDLGRGLDFSASWCALLAVSWTNFAGSSSNLAAAWAEDWNFVL